MAIANFLWRFRGPTNARAGSRHNTSLWRQPQTELATSRLASRART